MPEKHLRDFRRHLARLFCHFVKVTCRLLRERPFGGEQFAGESIERLVRAHRFANPFVILVRIAGPERQTIHAQQIGPLQRPEFRILGKLQQCIHEARTLVWRRAREEAPRLIRRR